MVTLSAMNVKDRSSPVDSTWKKWHPECPRSVCCTKLSETGNVTESFSEAMEDVLSAITDSQRSVSLDGVPRLQQQQ